MKNAQPKRRSIKVKTNVRTGISYPTLLKTKISMPTL